VLDPATSGIIVFVVLFVLLAIGVHIGVALGLGGLLGMYLTIGPDAAWAQLATIPLRRAGECEEDIGRVAVFLASEDSAYVTGQTMFVDGGSGSVR